MQRTQMIVAAGVAALGGAVSGAAINTKPLPRGFDAWDHVARPELTASQFEVEDHRPPPPNHYPLVTPQGRIEVAELRNHGLYRNRRFAFVGGWYEPAEEPAFHMVEADYQYVPDDFSGDASPPPAAPPPRPSAAPERTVATAADAEPLDLEEPVELAVKPRVINVPAELAGRQ